MTYALLDDKTLRNPVLRECGKDAAFLYAVALLECAQVDGDGVLTPLMVKDSAGLYDIPARNKHAAVLVEAGLWHDPSTLEDCPECSDVSDLKAGQFLIHEWWKPLLHADGKNDPIKRERELRRKRLWRDKDLVKHVRTRDKDLCRYCGVLCTDPSGPDKKAPTGLTLDHIDPFGGNTRDNVCVACRRCNGIKRDRTPDQAGMCLLKPGTVSEDPARVPVENPPRARVAREAGRIRHGTDMPGFGQGRVPAPVPDRSRDA